MSYNIFIGIKFTILYIYFFFYLFKNKFSNELISAVFYNKEFWRIIESIFRCIDDELLKLFLYNLTILNNWVFMLKNGQK